MLHWFYTAIANAIVALHKLIAPLFGDDSGITWGLSIVLLVVTIRILLFPLFVKQIKTQRAMMVIQPKVKELQAKYRGDRETLNQELMKLYRENNANPLGGCLPLLVQMPIFFALFKVLNSFKPDKNGNFHEHYGISKGLVQSAAQAKIFGAPIASSFRSSADTLRHLGASVGTVRGITIAMIVLMTATTFITQRQLMARNPAMAEGPMAQQQKILLYVLPFFFAIFGINFPVGVLLYWVTTNFWTMGQQFLVINRMHPVPVGGAVAAKPVTSNGANRPGRGAGQTEQEAPVADAQTGPAVRRQPQRKKTKKKRGRPGGRH
ncbi:MAG: YidC/Oxa1 family rane protein insertase [Frankiales bacterium]|jgi:YidC/Oxa1 family membrane protein insertase|nr:YidC/Oxa1 family rane protein insertase [Frankiales bacterium]